MRLYDVIDSNEVASISSINLLADTSTASIERVSLEALDEMSDIMDKTISLEAMMDDPYKSASANVLALEVLTALGEDPLAVSLEAVSEGKDQDQWVITRAVNGVYDKLKTVVKTVKTAYGDLKGAIAKRLEKASKLLTKAKYALGNVGNKVVHSLVKVGKLAKVVSSHVGVTFKTLKEKLAIMDRIKDVEKIIVKLAKDTYAKLAKLTDKVKIKKLVDSFNKKVASIWATVKTKGLGMVINVKDHARVLVTKVKTGTSKKATTIKKLTVEKVNDLISVYERSADKVKSSMSSTSKDIAALIKSIKGSVKTYSKEAVGKTKVLFANAYNTLLNAISTASTVVSRIWSWISETTVGFVSAMTKRITTAVGAG